MRRGTTPTLQITVTGLSKIEIQVLHLILEQQGVVIKKTEQDVSSVTAAAADVLANKVIVNSEGELVTGTMPNNGAVNAEIDGLTTTTYQVAAGYTSGGTVSLTDDIETALAAI